MSRIAFNNFGGEIPALANSMLPENCAQRAINCDFTNNTLTPLTGGALLNTFTSTNPVISLYTEDGILFFTWTTETRPFKGPVINDSYNRIYYLNGSTATVTSLDYASPSGGVPSTSYTVGVPFPTVAPTLSLVDRTTLADYPAATVAFTGWYDVNGVRTGEATLVTTNTVPLKEWTFTSAITPVDGGVLTVQCAVTDGSKELFTIDTSLGAEIPATTAALPGGIELSLTSISGSDYKITISWGVTETRAYIYTVENDYGEESAPSTPTLVSPTYIQDVSVGTTLPSVGSYVPFAGVNIYRTFGSNSTYLRVGTHVPNPFTDSSTTPVGVTSAMQSTDFYPPPTGLSGFGVAANGICYAFKGNTLYFSEPYRPHAYPYSMAFSRNIRGVCVGAQSMTVTTADGCYAVTGAHSSSMSQLKLPIPQAGLSARSMAQVDGSVAFASHDGIVLVTGSEATLDFSHKYFNRKDWRSRYSSALSGGAMNMLFADGSLIVAPQDTGIYGFMVRLDEGRNTMSRHNIAMNGMFYIPVLDTVYYSSGTSVYEFRGSSTQLTMDWWSKDFILEAPTNFAVGYIRLADTGSESIAITLYADGSVYHQVTITASGYFRIVGGSRATRWSVRIIGSGTVYELYLASSMAELKSV